MFSHSLCHQDAISNLLEIRKRITIAPRALLCNFYQPWSVSSPQAVCAYSHTRVFVSIYAVNRLKVWFKVLINYMVFAIRSVFPGWILTSRLLTSHLCSFPWILCKVTISLQHTWCRIDSQSKAVRVSIFIFNAQLYHCLETFSGTSIRSLGFYVNTLCRYILCWYIVAKLAHSSKAQKVNETPKS